MSDTIMLVLIIGGITFAVFLLPRILAKGMGTAIDAGQKAVFKKQIAESDDLIDVPLVLTSSATPAAILDALDAIIRPSKEPPGFDSVLYQVSREPKRAVYAIGSKMQPQQLVTELRLSEQGGKTEMVFRVLAAERAENIFTHKEALIRLREQVQYVAEAGGDEAKVAEGAYIYRATEQDDPKWQTWLARVGGALFFGAIVWLAVGVQIRLLPVLFLMFAGGGALIYIANRPASKRRRESSVEAARVLHPELAQDAVPAVAAVARVVVAPATAAIPVAEAAAVATGEPAAATATPTPGSGLVASFKAMPQTAKLAVVFGTIITVLIVAIVLIVGARNSRGSYADQSDSYVEEDYSYEGDEVAVEVDSEALSPDTHARMEEDLFGSAPADGSMEFSDVVFASGDDQGDGTASLEFTMVSRSPAEWYIIQVPVASLAYYIDDYRPTPSEFFQSLEINDTTKGMIVFDNEGVYELHIFNNGQTASASTPEKGQVIVPDFNDFDLSATDWAEMEWADALDAYIASIERGFKAEGLVAVVEVVRYSDSGDYGTASEAVQTPRVGMSVPAGTKVYITLPVAE